MQRQNCLGGSPVDCSLCKWCLGKGQINVFQGRMEMQMRHLLAGSALLQEGKQALLHIADCSLSV